MHKTKFMIQKEHEIRKMLREYGMRPGIEYTGSKIITPFTFRMKVWHEVHSGSASLGVISKNLYFPITYENVTIIGERQ